MFEFCPYVTQQSLGQPQLLLVGERNGVEQRELKSPISRSSRTEASRHTPAAASAQSAPQSYSSHPSTPHQRSAAGLPGLHSTLEFDHVGVSQRPQRLGGCRAHGAGSAVDRDRHSAIGGQPVNLLGDPIERYRQVRAGDVAFEWHMDVDRHPIGFGYGSGEFVSADQPVQRDARRRRSGSRGRWRLRGCAARCQGHGGDNRQCTDADPGEHAESIPP